MGSNKAVCGFSSKDQECNPQAFVKSVSKLSEPDPRLPCPFLSRWFLRNDKSECPCRNGSCMDPKMEVFEKVRKCCWYEAGWKMIVHSFCWWATKLRFYVGSYILKSYRILGNFPACMMQPCRLLFPNCLLCRWRKKRKRIKWSLSFPFPFAQCPYDIF